MQRRKPMAKFYALPHDFSNLYQKFQPLADLRLGCSDRRTLLCSVNEHEGFHTKSYLFRRPYNLSENILSGYNFLSKNLGVKKVVFTFLALNLMRHRHFTKFKSKDTIIHSEYARLNNGISCINVIDEITIFISIPQILPPTVVDDIKKGQIVQVEYFDAVTICFLDIVKFVAMIADYSPVQVVTLLNNL